MHLKIILKQKRNIWTALLLIVSLLTGVCADLSAGEHKAAAGTAAAGVKPQLQVRVKLDRNKKKAALVWEAYPFADKYIVTWKEHVTGSGRNDGVWKI